MTYIINTHWNIENIYIFSLLFNIYLTKKHMMGVFY